MSFFSSTSMLIRLEPSFIGTMQQLKRQFLEADKEELSELVELNHDKIRSVILAQEPTICPVRVDVMATPHAPDDPKVKYRKVAQLFDDGSIRSS